MITLKNPTKRILKKPGIIFFLLISLTYQISFSQLVVINEMQVLNESSVVDPSSGNYNGWIEVYNNTENAINLGSYYLSNDLNNLTKWKFPSGSFMTPRSYITVWTDGTNENTSGNYHTSFSLSQNGGKLILYSTTFGIVDSLTYGKQYVDISYGRYPNTSDNLYFFKTNSLLTDNNSDTINRNSTQLSPPTFSIDGGLFSAPFSVTITNTDSTGSQVFYTTDGSIPDNSSNLYSSPIYISSSTVLKAVAYDDNKISSTPTTQSYIFDNTPNLPVISISTESEHLWNASSGIYTEQNKNELWERAAIIEMYDTSGALAFNKKAGIRLFGKTDRNWDMKSLSINFSSKYGDDHINYKLFDSKPIERFESFVLRNSGDDWNYTLIRDALMQSLVKDVMDVDYREYQPCIVYLNGQYWGIHNIRENVDATFIEENYGYKADEIDLLENDASVIEGTANHFTDLDTYISTNDMSNDGAIDYIETQMDLDEFLNYQIAEIYFGNAYWPGDYIKFWRPQQTDGIWRWILCLADGGFGLNDISFNMVEQGLGGSTWANQHMRELLNNDNLKNEFIQRFATHMSISFLPEIVTSKINELKQGIEADIPQHISKWGVPANVTTWNNEVNKLITFGENRADTIKQHMSDFFGLTGTYELNISNTEPEKGYIEITGISIPEEYTGVYFNNVPVRIRAKSRPGYKFERWEGASTSTNAEIYPSLSTDTVLTAVFGPAEPLSGISINEVSVRPENKILDNFDELENWIELFNATSNPINIGGLYLSNDPENLNKFYIPDDYPELTTVAPNSTMVFYTDNSPNEGILHTNFSTETMNDYIALSQRIDVGYKAIDSVIMDAQYEGSTYSRYPNGSENWQYTPPTPDATNQIHSFITGVYINELSSDNINQITDEQGEYSDWIEIYNSNDFAVDLGGLFISDDKNNRVKYRIPSTEPDSTSIEANDYLILWADNDTADGIQHLPFTLNNTGEILLIQANGFDVVDSTSFENQYSNTSISRLPDGGSWQYANASPGATNYANVLIGLVINEFSADNQSILKDENDEYDDWLEIMNTNDFSVDIGGLFVTNNFNDPTKYMISNLDPATTTIQPGEFILLWLDNQDEQGDLHTNFTLDVNGGEIGLMQINGSDFVDSLSYTKQFNDASMGSWPDATENYQFTQPSPGDSNFIKDFSGIIINEFSAGNTSLIADENSEFNDWIELHNTNAFPLDIGGMLITNDKNELTKYRIAITYPDSTIIQAGGYLVLWADNQEEQGILHLGLDLAADTAEIILVNQDGGSIIDSISYDSHFENAAFGEYPDASNDWQYVSPTPGAANVVDSLPGLVINEYSSDNVTLNTDDKGKYNDWIEIYNKNTYEVNVGGLYMTNDLNAPKKYRIPTTYPDSTLIKPGGYIVLWADNQESQGVLHMNFELDNNGDQIGLSQINGRKFIDTLTFEKQNPNAAVGLIPNGTGSWQYVEPTPNAKNYVRTASGLVINEFCSDNINIVTDNKGEYSDWIEIYNTNSFSIDVGGLFLTNDLNAPSKYKIPTTNADSTTIPAEGYLVLWADNQVNQGILHLGFTLESTNEQIGLVQYNGIDFIDSLSYTKQPVNSALGIYPDGTGLLQYVDASPGSTNYFTEINGLVINEFSADNISIISDGSGEYEDYIEIYNTNNYDVDLGGLFLTNDFDDLIMHRIPDTDPSATTIPALGHLIVWADGQSEQGADHLSFELNANGGQIGLVAKNGKYFIDFITFAEQYANSSEGRLPDASDNWKTMTPTPGQENQITLISGLYINEYSASNTSIIKDDNGEYNDWIEIYNSNNEDINIGGLYITNDLNSKTKYRIPSTSPASTTIPANGYIILWADGTPEQGELHLNFELAVNGDIGLTQQDGQTLIDDVTYGSFRENSSIGRVPDGTDNWEYMNCSPGATNISGSSSSYLGIKINEFSANNSSIIRDEYGEANDWIEIYNATIYDVNIGGLYISNDPNKKTKYRIPTDQPEITTVKSKGYIVLWADNSMEQGPLHLNFELDEDGGEIHLQQPNGDDRIDNVSYNSQLTNSSYGRYPDGSSTMRLQHSSPGFKNLITGYNNVIINEFGAYNTSTIPDEKGNYVDWIELHNTSSSSVDISGMYISYTDNNKTRYRIPSSQPDSTTIPANGYIVLWADNRPEDGVLHLNFELNNDGDGIVICDFDGSSVIQSTSYEMSYRDASIGRYPNASGNFEVMNPTPGGQNQQIILSDVVINEFSANNTSIISDENGDYSDWIEIYNTGEESIDIGGAFITNSLSDLTKFRIPSTNSTLTTIAPNDYLVLWADNSPEKGVLHLGFELNENSGEIGIAKIQGDEFINSLSYDSQFKNYSSSRYPDGSSNIYAINPTPGESNVISVTGNIVINEIKIKNNSHIDEHGDFEDWIEIYNTGSGSVDLGGLYITNNLSDELMWRIPTDQPEKTTVAAGGFLVLYADNDTDHGSDHLGFKLNSDKTLVLYQYNPDGNVLIDNVTYEDMNYKQSYGRYTDGTDNWSLLGTPTPGNGNVLTQIFNPTMSEALDIYPNPSYRQIVHLNKTCTYAVYNSIGVKVMEKVNENTINTSQLEKGWYIVQTSEGEMVKLIVL